MKKSDFLNYLSSIIQDKETQSIYYDNNDQYFYFYHKNFTYELKSTSSSAFVNLVEEQHGKKIIHSIPLTQDEMITLIEYCLPNIVTDNYFHENTIKEKGQVFTDCIKTLDEYLKNYNPKTEIEKCESLQDFNFTFPFDGINHICRIGKIAHHKSPKDYPLTSLVKIPFIYLKSNEKNLLAYLMNLLFHLGKQKNILF